MAELKWWQKAVFYQIYPRSFAGSGRKPVDPVTKDGIGDLQGIIERLDYLKELGIGGIWLSPHFPSPFVDCGYDVADYTGVEPEYGNLDDFKRFLDGAHQRGMRVILDLVLNHTSDQHGWFLESRSSRTNTKADWYVWRDGKDGGPPNNWNSTFGGPAWEWDPARGQYYYHFFFKEQPDLNWRNPEVKAAMFNAMRFWLDMGVDGFRIDAIGTCYEHPDLPDHRAVSSQAEMAVGATDKSEEKQSGPFGEEWKRMYFYQVDQPEMYDLLRDLRRVTDEYQDRVLIGESDDISYCASDMLHMVFNFPLMRHPRLTPEVVRENQEERLAGLAELNCPAPGAWPCNTLGNHDSPRLFTRFGDGENNASLARLHLALMLTLKGTPFLYNGEEIGMTDLYLQDLDQFRDNLGVWWYHLHLEQAGMTREKALEIASQFTRDKCRTPMQWDYSANAGFCASEIKPWLPVNPNYRQGVNVSDQDRDPASLLNFYRKLIRVRNETPPLIEGEYLPLHPHAQKYLAFLRKAGGSVGLADICLVVLNLSADSLCLDFSDAAAGTGKLLFSTSHRAVEINLADVEISPFEVLIVQCNGSENLQGSAL